MYADVPLCYIIRRKYIKIQLYRVKCTKIKNLLKYITYRYYQGVYVIFFTICYIFIN